VNQVVASLALSIEARKLRLVLDGAASTGLVSGDATRLSQVIWNLVSNAVKFTPPGGRIDISLRRVGSQAVLQVKDSGEGIDRDHLALIFERFRQTDSSISRRHGGLGLGLAIVRHLAELHGGTADAESEGLGRGSLFTVRLPLIAVHLPSASRSGERPAARSADAQPLRGIEVLAVDDSPDALTLLQTILRRNGATVSTATSVSEALALLETCEPAVIVSDLSMPGETGFDLLRRIQELEAARSRSYPVVALTAHARRDERERALAAGFRACIAKPFDQRGLVGEIAALVTEKDRVRC
jgi:CheY-like chemotaxis protein